MAKFKIRNFLKPIFEVSIKIFCRKWEVKLSPNDSSILSSFKNAKTGTVLTI